MTPPYCYLGKKRPPLFRSKKSVLFLVPICLKYCHGNHKPPKTGLLHDLIQFGLSFLCYSGRFCIENWPNFHFNKKNCSSIWFIQTEFLMYGWCLTGNPIFPLAPLEYGAYHSNEISLCTNLDYKKMTCYMYSTTVSSQKNQYLKLVRLFFWKFDYKQNNRVLNFLK